MRCLLLLLALSSTAAAQVAPGEWSTLPASPQAFFRWEDGSFPDPSHGWVVGNGGQVHRTTDGGDSWVHVATLMEDGEPLFLRSTTFATPSHGFIGTLFADANVLLETLDGGSTWMNITGRIAGFVPDGICGMWAVSEQVIVAVGWFDGPSAFLKTTDGGQTWTSTPMDVTGLVDVYFHDDLRGVAVGTVAARPPPGNNPIHPRILTTEDGGVTWTLRHTSAAYGWAWKVSFPTPTTGYVSGGDATPSLVMRTTDGGLTWTDLLTGHGGGQSVGFVSDEVGWASGRGTTIETRDSGATWSTIPLDGRINRFRFFGDTLGYAMGARVYRYTAGPVTAEPGPDRARFRLDPPYPNPSRRGVTLSYALGVPAAVRLTVYDALGRRVAVLAEGAEAAGTHVMTWDPQGDDGRRLPAGLYLIRLDAAGQHHVQPLVVRS